MSQRDVKAAGGGLFADDGQDGFIHRAFLRGAGYSADETRRSPVVGVCSSWSELNPCNAGLRELAEAVKAGVRAAGGLPLEFPTISISEPYTRPSSLYLRNLMSMDVEETVRASPIDGVVLLGGCDKTVPAAIMGAISAGKPALLVVAGPRPVPCIDGEPFTIDDFWPVATGRRLGVVDDRAWHALEGGMNTGVGTCNVMGTATTMAAVAELLGFALPGSALAPAASEARRELARATGRAIVDAIARAQTPATVVTPESMENAVRVVCALGGSTNAVIHLEAIAGRAGFAIGAACFERWSSSTPVLADVRPTGRGLLADLEREGGVPAVAARLAPLLHLEALAATGEPWRTIVERQDGPVDERREPTVLHTLAAPLAPRGALVMLTGALAPGGAVLKTAGVHDARLRRHRGRAVVFDGIDDLNRRIDDPTLDVDADSVLVLRGVGMIGAPGMPEVGHIPIPARLAAAGVRDMLRVSDARMSGTATGTVVLHVTPEAALDGPLARVTTGDEIELDADAGALTVHVSPAELASRTPYAPPPMPTRGFAWLHRTHALQPDHGCDFDFLRGTPEPLSPARS